MPNVSDFVVNELKLELVDFLNLEDFKNFFHQDLSSQTSSISDSITTYVCTYAYLDFHDKAPWSQCKVDSMLLAFSLCMLWSYRGRMSPLRILKMIFKKEFFSPVEISSVCVYIIYLLYL